MLEAVIFDMDGVIVDSEPWHLEANFELYEELGFTLSREDYATFIGKTNSEMWVFLKSKFALPQSLPELFQRQVQKKIQLLQKHEDGLIKGVLPLLNTLREKGIPIGLASSSPLEYIETILKKYQIAEYFQAVVTGEEMANGKPAPDIFLHTAGLLGVKSENCVVIEDSENGVKAAKAGAMKCIGFKNINSGGQDLSLADRIVDSLEEISIDGLQALINKK